MGDEKLLLLVGIFGCVCGIAVFGSWAWHLFGVWLAVRRERKEGRHVTRLWE